MQLDAVDLNVKTLPRLARLERLTQRRLEVFAQQSEIAVEQLSLRIVLQKLGVGAGAREEGRHCSKRLLDAWEDINLTKVDMIIFVSPAREVVNRLAAVDFRTRARPADKQT
eukprot:6210378-Pleurochrysis_carterae.AAC.6